MVFCNVRIAKVKEKRADVVLYGMHNRCVANLITSVLGVG